MRPGWREVRLKHLAAIEPGQSPPSSVVTDLGDELPFLQGNAEFGPLHPLPRLQCATAPKRAREGDLLVSVRAPVGALNVADRPLGIGRGLASMRVRSEEADPRFLWWLMHEARIRLAAHSVGSTYDAVSSEVIGALPGLAPVFEEQRRIADHLDAETARIDALIALRQRQIELLDERLISSISADVTAIPRWAPLRYLVRFREGPGIMASDFRDEGVPLLRLRNMVEGRVRLEGCGRLDPSMVATRWSQFRVRLGDVLVSGSASLGGSAVVDDSEVVGAIPYTGLIILRPTSSEVHLEFVRGFLRSASFIDQITQLKTGATMEHFGPTHLSAIKAPAPDGSVQRQFAAHWAKETEHSARVSRSLNRQIELLRERRQALITALVTGEAAPP